MIVSLVNKTGQPEDTEIRINDELLSVDKIISVEYRIDGKRGIVRVEMLADNIDVLADNVEVHNV